MKQNICWDCQKATGGCSWSEIDPNTGRVRFEPPDGAEYKLALLDSRDRANAVMTYHITSCPEFVPDEPRKTDNLELKPGTFLNWR